MTTIAPNPPSPYADADPSVRHIFPTLVCFGFTRPGALALAGCDRLAVVPEELTEVTAGIRVLPDGLCPSCIAAMRGQELPPDVRPVNNCLECDRSTYHDGLCALCRQEKHDEWWQTRDTPGAPLASDLDQHPTKENDRA